ncbi:DUF3124 domain-containing protein [Lutibacter sp. A80]|uniref:DUF3124 domain-containing protein n=1 Tax=Lutibacter sp. A80 TaxID=2918453 RepID=UPI001F06A1E1|nr:DUF3124 domain-containing protein [Lutibacter sp. A80]UMB61087.1 DUF3124 domain-containing protein [Lutibacter sp. A80]
MEFQIYNLKVVKKLVLFLSICMFLFSCQEKKEFSSIEPNNWSKRTVDLNNKDSLVSGKTYLSVYSQIYSSSEDRTHNLTVTVSMKNINLNDTIYVEKANYYDTKGNLIRTYFDKDIFIAPLETVEIIIDEVDQHGGTGANFVFSWKKEKQTNDPHFESIMISTFGQQGLSFTSQGIKLE